MRKIQLTWKDLLSSLLLALLYFGAAKVGLLFACEGSQFSPIRPQSGIALAALLLWGYRPTPGIFLGALLTDLSLGASWGGALITGAGSTAEAALTLFLLRRARFDRCLPRLRDMWLLLAFGALLGPTISASAGVGWMIVSAWRSLPPPLAWATWWLGDAVSILILAPLLLMTAFGQRRTWREYAEMLATLLFLLASSFIVFWDPFPKLSSFTGWGYLVFPVLLYAGLRTGMRGAALSNFLLAILAVAATALGHGPFALRESHPHLLQLDIFLGIASVTTLGFAAAIAERAGQEKKLRLSEERFANAFFASPVGMTTTRLADGKFVDVNDTFLQMFEFQREEVIGHTSTELQIWMPEERQRIIQAQQQTGGLRDFELRAHAKSGREIQILFSSQIIEVEGEKHLLTTMVDITARKQAEEDRLARQAAERANQAKSEFLSRMSHELRTPLNAIIGFAQLLDMDDLTADQRENVGQILKSGRHLLNLINEVLDIARIEAGRLKISPEVVHLFTALQEAVDLIRPLAEQRGITMCVKVPSSQDVFITADLQRLKQVLLNLLSNAVKYNRQGGEIHVAASLLVDGFMHLEVRDSGEGLPPEKLSRLFIPFERLEETPTTEGTGLGLALSKGLVEAMGGRMGAASVLGRGSTFWFDLPLTTEQKEVAVMAEVEDYLKESPSTNTGLILYVEDNLSNIKLVEKIIARLPDVKLVTAMQGRLALDLARAQKPDLILLDIHLPDINGDEVLQQLRANPETAAIPVVIMSADATHVQIERMLAAGVQDYLTKPIDVRRFLDMVAKIIGE